MSESAATPGKSKRLRRADVAARRVIWSIESGAFVQATRLTLGISQPSLAKLVGISPHFVDRIEGAFIAPSPTVLDKICDVLNLVWFQPTAMVANRPMLNTRLVEVSREWADYDGEGRRHRKLSHRPAVAEATIPAAIAPSLPTPADE